MIDLFRPAMHHSALARVGEVITPDADGRIYCGQGPRVDRFEQEFFGLLVRESRAETIPDLLPLSMNSGTSALSLALHLAGVKPGGIVISTPMTCTATNGAIAQTGAKILWADVDPLTGCIDPVSVWRLLEAYGPKVSAIMAVDWGGRHCNYGEIQASGAQRHYQVPVIRDAAHSIDWVEGPTYTCWSFQAIKFLTCGDGGALLPPEDQYKRAKLLRWYGLDRESSADFRCEQDIGEIGWKYHLNDISAAIGLANISDVERLVYLHRENAAWYTKRLQYLPGVDTPPYDPACSYWLYSILVGDRDGFTRYAAERGVSVSQVHARNDRHSAFRAVSVNPLADLPGLESFASHQTNIPVGWWVSERDRETVADTVAEWSRSWSSSGGVLVGAQS